MTFETGEMEWLSEFEVSGWDTCPESCCSTRALSTVYLSRVRVGGCALFTLAEPPGLLAQFSTLSRRLIHDMLNVSYFLC